MMQRQRSRVEENHGHVLWSEAQHPTLTFGTLHVHGGLGWGQGQDCRLQLVFQPRSMALGPSNIWQGDAV